MKKHIPWFPPVFQITTSHLLFQNSCLPTFSRLSFGTVTAQLLIRVRLFGAPCTAAHQASLPFTKSRSSLKFISTESVMLSNHFILCHPLLLLLSIFPASGSSPMSWLFSLGGQSVGASASASVLLMNIQGWFPSGLTGLISLQCKGLSRVFSNTTVQKHQFSDAQPSLWFNSHIHTWLLEKP